MDSYASHFGHIGRLASEQKASLVSGDAMWRSRVRCYEPMIRAGAMSRCRPYVSRFPVQVHAYVGICNVMFHMISVESYFSSRADGCGVTVEAPSRDACTSTRAVMYNLPDQRAA